MSVLTNRTIKPGWTEILAGLGTLAVVAFGLPYLLNATGVSDRLSPVVGGLFLAALSGVAGLAGFLVADRIRIRDWAAFGIVRTSTRWLLIGIAGGLLAMVLSRLAAAAFLYLAGPADDIQAPYREAAQGGLVTVILSILFLAILTPIGEEFLFRGVVTTALLRYGALIGVIASSVIFALAHGLNSAFLTALIVGLVAAELRRRSGSIWPAVLVHVVNNLIGQLIVVALT
ncbi:lysostaphin resistance A-like protein [Catenuloplanes sp. NPDC051500]|uniref:lysostaphin resistance A-like protein n=1 Tax=Catenuloplanes sp. NPDC051500 TaxID=3363959 RepID=UPI0037B62FEE